MIKQDELVPKRRFEGFVDEWKKHELGEVSNIIGGGTPSTSVKEFWNGEIDWYSPVEIGDSIYVSNSQRKISELGFKKSSTNLLPAGTILFTSRAGIGKTAILKKEGTTNQGFQSIVPIENILDTYFLYSRSNELKVYGEKKASGSTFMEISGKQLEKMNISLPPKKEQQKIGQFFKHLDDMIAIQQRKIDKTKALKSAYLAEMFPAEGERIPKRRFAGFTDEWEEIDLGKLGIIQSGIGFPEKDQGGKKGIPFIKVSDMNIPGNEIELIRTNHYVNQKKIDEKRWHPITETPALIFAKVGAAIFLGRKRLINQPFLIDNNMMSYAFNSFWDINFGKILFEKLNLSRYAQVGALPSLSASDIANIRISIPTKKEQQKIGQFFKHLDEMIATHQQKLEKLKATKQAYLHEMFV